MREKLFALRSFMTKTTGYIAAALLFTMCSLVLYQVFTRYVLNNPSDFTEELVRYMLIWTGFIGATSAFGSREHMALVLLLEKLNPLNRNRLQAVIDIIILALAVLVLLMGGIQNAIRSMNAMSPLLEISRGVVYAITPISAVFLIVIQVVNIYEDLTSNKAVETNAVEG